MNGFTDRQQLLAEMRNGKSLNWDVIVVGGGITGAGVLREARRRGYKALLLEQQDFSWAPLVGHQKWCTGAFAISLPVI
jgi:glycine/D-amino acid oxidase-like deaminating enzyme